MPKATWNGTVLAETVEHEIDGKRNENAAWYCSEQMEAASNIAGHVAFWHGVEVVR